MTITIKRGEVFDWTFRLEDQASYPGLEASSQLRDGDGALLATFDVSAADNGDQTADIQLRLTQEQVAALPLGNGYFDIKISMSGWGPHLTETITLAVEKGETE
ncbi:MAG: hypothetical protein DVB31_02940 [Verrucomicrobia bacterium]|nr:MAG: hypothetical protein DVB31_02940 [Verrucomicrobiota bacterium]